MNRIIKILIIAITASCLLCMSVAALSRMGSVGNEVTSIQNVLKKKGYYSGAVDGIFGSRTLAAVKQFQRDNGLTVDGIAGPKTLKALGLSSSGSDFSSNDYNLLARIISALLTLMFFADKAFTSFIFHTADMYGFFNYISEDTFILS